MKYRYSICQIWGFGQGVTQLQKCICQNIFHSHFPSPSTPFPPLSLLGLPLSLSLTISFLFCFFSFSPFPFLSFLLPHFVLFVFVCVSFTDLSNFTDSFLSDVKVHRSPSRHSSSLLYFCCFCYHLQNYYSIISQIFLSLLKFIIWICVLFTFSIRAFSIVFVYFNSLLVPSSVSYLSLVPIITFLAQLFVLSHMLPFFFFSCLENKTSCSREQIMGFFLIDM